MVLVEVEFLSAVRVIGCALCERAAKIPRLCAPLRKRSATSGRTARDVLRASMCVNAPRASGANALNPANSRWIVDGHRVADILAGKHLVTAPPTVGVRGRYEWLPGRAIFEIPLAVPPQWLIDVSKARGVTTGGKTPKVPSGAAPTPADGGFHPLVTPPAPQGRYASRSEEDAAFALELHCEGRSHDAIVEALLSRPAAGARLYHQLDYAERTAESAIAYADAMVPHCRVERVRLRKSKMHLHLVVLEGPHVSEARRLELDWPVTPRSAPRWRALCDALDLPETDPQLVREGAMLAVQLVGPGRRRVGRVYPPRRAL